MKILMVCLGNICRSPLAEGILRKIITNHQLNWTVDSAGTGDWHVGHAPDKRSIAVAGKNGIDISTLRGRQFSTNDFKTFDHILVMDSENYANVIRLASNETEKQKVELLLNYVNKGKNETVPDPYWDDSLFSPVYDLIYQACEHFVAFHQPQN